MHFAINRSRLAAKQTLDSRTVKGPLLAHPLFVHTDQRIEGLVWITLAALLVQAILERLYRQHDLPYTAAWLMQGFVLMYSPSSSMLSSIAPRAGGAG